ncbi:hypothetical protein ANCDUO_16331, partial [Ancylostoma duodenale]
LPLDFIAHSVDDAPTEFSLSSGIHGETSVGKSEDSIPVIEIRGEGKPMTAAQIRHLEEITNGGPLDIKASSSLRFGIY